MADDHLELEVAYCVGGVLSPLLSNIYGHALDALWTKEASHLGKIIRYADDLVILCRTESDAKQAYAWLQRTAQALHLKVHPDKSRVLHVGDRGGRLRLSGVSPPDGDVAQVRQAILPADSIAPRDGECAGQDQSDHGSTPFTEAAHA
ncbi:MAG: reverse transcriptase domain-containing protein [Candidatus Dormibacteraceae bacterium]